VFCKEKSAKYKKPITNSSNALWIVELKDVHSGGVVHFKSEIRLKHMGIFQYLTVRKLPTGRQ
jgi:hypothetical protein